MSKRQLLTPYIPLISFIGEVCGKNYEVILHDVSTPSQSVLVICNGHISGRKVGDPITDLARNLIKEGIYKEKDYIANYEGRTKDGKTFVSSTYFIKDHQRKDELIGMICINHDPADMLEMQHRLSRLMDAFSIVPKEETSYTEVLDSSISNLSQSLIQDTIKELSVPPKRMTPEEKMSVLRTLEQQGVFETKGAVRQVALKLDISEPTVYRYLKKIREKENS